MRCYISFLSKMVLKGIDKEKPVVLCVGRSLFKKDYKQFSQDKTFAWIWVDTYMLKLALDDIVPSEYQHQTQYIDSLELHKEEWRSAINLMSKFLEKIKKRVAVNSVLTANIDYWQDYALKKAAQDQSVKVVVLSKEFPINKKVSEEYRRKYYKFEHLADYICCFGSRLQDIFIDSGLGNKNNIVVTGAPRLDAWRSAQYIQSGNIVTLLSFREGYGGDSEIFFYDVMERTIKALEIKSEKYVLYIKAKNKIDEKLIKEEVGESKNVIVTSSVELTDLLPRSKIIIGFNSLSLVEALLTESVILVPDWHGLDKKEDMLSTFSFVPPGTINLVTKEKLSKLLENIESTVDELAPIRENRLSMLKEFMQWDDDETSTEKLVKILKKEGLKDKEIC
ncbi:hypothetical protein [Halomonas sp. MCCC 1A11062]|uniref:hypothetical protein n=1 Tax=Halomonas sp. MCCC 1A11062 TaxID=2733485 RepID=UPI001F21BB75|nr:hypothetical protein [Halomonas sp. MCCC 1A11062]MCE8038921.1 hypothetical protein [Halomonas sp. MCCC 1A11062]